MDFNDYVAHQLHKFLIKLLQQSNFSVSRFGSNNKKFNFRSIETWFSIESFEVTKQFRVTPWNFSLSQSCFLFIETHLFTWWINRVLFLNLNELHCRSRVSWMRCAGGGVVKCWRISRKPFADWIRLQRLVSRWQNFRCRCCTVIDHQRWIRCAVVQDTAGGPNCSIDASILHRFSAITSNGSIWEAMKCEIRICQERHRSDAWDLKEWEEESRIRLQQ